VVECISNIIIFKNQVQVAIEVGDGVLLEFSHYSGVFSDIPISIKSLKDSKKIKNAMIIDLDVHQGNGFISICNFRT
jgi:hypothetical protein